MKKIILLACILVSAVLTRASAAELQMPPFLPDYFFPAFTIDEKQLLLDSNITEPGSEKFSYSTENQSLSLSVESIKCDRARCIALLENIIGSLNNQIMNKEGEFRVVTQSDVYAVVHEDKLENYVFAYVLNSSIQIWTYGGNQDDTLSIGTMFDMIGQFANRQRYHEALSAGNVSMGHWGSKIHDYARQLLLNRRKEEAVSVLKNLLPASPFKYDAHIDLIENTTDRATAKNSAKVVFENAENSTFTNKAAKFLEIPEPVLVSIPLLEKNEKGLQLILIPLLPCNLWILEDIAKTYETITDVPVKIRRLKEVWELTAPDRTLGQRDVQSLLVKLRGKDIDFTGWTKTQYAKALLKASESVYGISQYILRDLVNEFEKKPGQYFVGPYLDWFSRTLKKYRSDDDRTMYVGITEANIYSGDSNFVFSVHTRRKASQAGIMSYSMMLAETRSEEFESRQRLIERIAKELVPPSLKSLGVPRSTDPKDPYSISSGMDHLDQKRLILSDAVREELETRTDFSVRTRADFDDGMDAYRRRDYAVAVKKWRPLAEQGLADAQFYLGMMYQQGAGVPRDDKETVKWYRLAAEQGVLGAQYNLGLMYARGVGGSKKYEEAYKWFRFAAEQGFAGAMGDLALMYARGLGAPKDYVEAYRWAYLATEKGDKKAAKLKVYLSKQMSPEQISEAGRRVSKGLKVTGQRNFRKNETNIDPETETKNLHEKLVKTLTKMLNLGSLEITEGTLDSPGPPISQTCSPDVAKRIQEVSDEEFSKLLEPLSQDFALKVSNRIIQKFSLSEARIVVDTLEKSSSWPEEKLQTFQETALGKRMQKLVVPEIMQGIRSFAQKASQIMPGLFEKVDARLKLEGITKVTEHNWCLQD